MLWFNNINLNKNQILNRRMQQLATAPSTPVTGQEYYDTVANKAYYWNGTAWVDMSGGAETVTGASNVGTGTGFFKQLATGVLQFLNLKAGSTKVTISTVSDDVVVDVNEANLSLNNIGGTLGVAKGGTGATTLTGIVKGNGSGAMTVATAGTDYLGTVASPTAQDILTVNASGVPIDSGKKFNDAGSSVNDILSASEINTRITAIIGTSDAMVYKGALDCSANPNYPASDKGWTYKVSVAGKIGGASGKVVRVGDMIICNTDGTVAGDQTAVGSKWDVVPTQSGTILKAEATIGDGTATSYTVTHNFNGNVSVNLYENASPYSMVFADVELTNANTITIKFASAPTTNQFKVVILG